MTNRVQATGPESAELAALLKRADEALTDPAWNRSNELEADLIRDLVARLRAATAAGEATPIPLEGMLPMNLAVLFHETYERLAPSFGYETRKDTRYFQPNTPNGQLMIAVCEELLGRPYTAPPEQGWRGEVTVTTDEAGNCVAVTRNDDEGRILSVIWERKLVGRPLPPPHRSGGQFSPSYKQALQEAIDAPIQPQGDTKEPTT